MNRDELTRENQRRGWEAYALESIIIDRMVPDIMQIESTSVCNLRCVFCPYDQLTRPREFLAVADLERILDSELGHVSAMGLHHFGEPFLHPELDRIVAACSSRGIGTTISTNATKLTQAMVDRVLSAGLTRLIVSMDATTSTTFESLRPPGDFDAVIAGATLLVTRKRELSAKTFFQFQFIVTPENAHEREDFIRRWSGVVGVDQVVVRDERTHASQVVRHDAYVRRDGERLPCRYLWESVVILADGTVVPCCKDFDGREPLGNLLRGDRLADIWNSPRMVALRKAHVERRFANLPLCGPCNEWAGHVPDRSRAMDEYDEYRMRKRGSRSRPVLYREFE